MFSFVILFSLAFAATDASGEPDCSVIPTYLNGIGFLPSNDSCIVYYMCVKNPNFNSGSNAGASGSDLYRVYTFCCAEGLAWDQDHLTCVRDSYCVASRDPCPDETSTTNTPCPNMPDPDGDETKFFTGTYEMMMCPYGQVWNQEYCTCIARDVLPAACNKLLNYTFTDDSYDSYSCYNFAVGVPYGNPSLAENMLCLDGTQALSIPFLNNWFAWNPVGKTFSLCFWFRVKPEQTAGVFSLNINAQEESLLDIYLVNGELVVNLAGVVVPTGEYPPYEYWNKVCVVFDKGQYALYYNGALVTREPVNPMPLNSQTDATLGFVDGFSPVYGYVDDLMFWTIAISEQDVVDCYNAGPSNNGPVLSLGGA